MGDETVQETNNDSSFCHLYKLSGVSLDQNKRRERLLEEQKSRRNHLLDDARGIQIQETFEFEETEEYKNVRRKYKRFDNEKYKNRIMYSEWLMEIPHDFDTSWLMKLCPKGHRNLVAATGKITKSFSKTGKFEYEFESALPGGSELTIGKTTILDCVWNDATNTFYILDVLVWASYDLTASDAEMRFFWLKSKLAETLELEKQSDNNIYKFTYVQHYACDYLLIKECLEQYPFYENNTPKIDGLLFYHKQASYTAGSTPLVGWLKPFMVPEILNISINCQYLKQRPSKYVNLSEYVRYNTDKRNKQKKIDMDISMDNCNHEEEQECDELSMIH